MWKPSVINRLKCYPDSHWCYYIFWKTLQFQALNLLNDPPGHFSFWLLWQILKIQLFVFSCRKHILRHCSDIIYQLSMSYFYYIPFIWIWVPTKSIFQGSYYFHYILSYRMLSQKEVFSFINVMIYFIKATVWHLICFCNLQVLEKILLMLICVQSV